MNDSEPHRDARGTAYQWSSCLLFFLGTLFYCYGIVHFARIHVAAEALITVAFVVLASRWFRREGEWVSRVRLMLLESFFNLICLLAKVLFLLGIVTQSGLVDNLFAAFFVLQVLGFVVSQLRKKRFAMLPASLAMGVGLAFWYASGSGVSSTPDGALHFWGGDAPLPLRWMYVFWVLGVILIEYRQLLPKATILCAHVASVAVAFTSDEFFHARILTASHLFVINFVILFEKRAWGGDAFASLPWLFGILPGDEQERRNRMILSVVINVLTVGTLTYWLGTA